MYPRKELFEKLATVSGALAPANSPVPLNTHFWFTGKRLMAFNGRMAMMIPMVTAFVGAVPPKLMQLLKTSKADEVQLEANDAGDTLTVRLGKAKADLAMLTNPFTFTMPASNAQYLGMPFGCDPGHFHQCMEAALRSCGKMTHTIDMLGITLDCSDPGYLDIFATDGDTFSTAAMKFEDGTWLGKHKRIVVPTDWCKEWVKHSKGDAEHLIDVADDYIMADLANGLTIYSAVLEPDDPPINFRKDIATVYGDGESNARFKVPDNINEVLERAVVIVQRAKLPTKVMLEVDGSDLTISAQSEVGQVREMLHIGGTQRRATLRVDPKRVLDGAKAADRMVITDEAVIFTRDKWVFGVSAKQG